MQLHALFDMYEKTNVDGFVRDTSSQAILNTDNVAYAAYKQRRRALSENAALRNEVDGIKNELHDIKELLARLLREQNK